MTSYFSAAFFVVFLPATVALYGVLPRRAKPFALLAASYAFFWTLSHGLIVFLLASTVSVYLLGLALGKLQSRRDALLAEPGISKKRVRKRFTRPMRCAVALGVVLNLGMICALKYAGFFSDAASGLLGLAGLPALPDPPSIGIPIGISFYTLQAISYLVDVYRGTVRADRNLGRMALFLSFFPQIMEGPISRYAETAERLWAGERLTARNVYAGGMRMLVGIAKKMIVADRVNIFVGTVFSGYASYDGGIVALAAVLYTFQLYCDFSGTMDVALGIGRMFGVELPENFRQPFASRTASEFWKRWHVTLGAWLRDYVFYPVSLSKPVKRLTGRARKLLGNRYGPVAAGSVALGCVWLANGLWHGAGTQYLFFGFYYFAIILAGGFLEPTVQRTCARLGIDRRSGAYRALQTARTFVVVCVGEMFFRAPGLRAGLAMFGALTGRFSLDSLADGTVFKLGLDQADVAVLAVSALVMLALGALRERNVDLIGCVWKRGTAARWAACCLVLCAVVLFGAYGVGYQPVNPMYAQF